MTHVELRKEGRERAIRCSGLKWEIDRERATVAVSIPRWCIGRPRWVRVGIGVVTMPTSDGADSGTIYADDALRHGIGEDVRRSPRVYRG
jgi:hypothetical protein